MSITTPYGSYAVLFGANWPAMWVRESDLLDHMRLPCESLYAERAGYQVKEFVRYDCFTERTFTNGQLSLGAPLSLAKTPMIEHHRHGQMMRSQFTQ